MITVARLTHPHSHSQDALFSFILSLIASFILKHTYISSQKREQRNKIQAALMKIIRNEGYISIDTHIKIYAKTYR